MAYNAFRYHPAYWFILLVFCFTHPLSFAQSSKSSTQSSRKPTHLGVKKPAAAKNKKMASKSKPLARHAIAKIDADDVIGLRARAALVLDQVTGEILFEKKAHEVLPIASITKLMMALVLVESDVNLDKKIKITDEDLRATMRLPSRLQKNSSLTRRDMLQLALMSSENRAASALARTHPEGRAGFIKAMNQRAQSLGMTHSRFKDATGLSNGNLSTPHDLVKLVIAAEKFPIIKEFSTMKSQTVRSGKRWISYANSNKLINDDTWQIALQKTGTTSKAGRCVILLTTISERPVIMVLLQSQGSMGRVKDARNLRSWIEEQSPVANLQQMTMINSQ